jgi:hypothetical protein
MTPIAGFVLAIFAGRTGSRSRAVRWLLVPWLATLAVQTGWLAAGRGNNPASTVTRFPDVIGYVVVQLISLALAAWVARGFADRHAADPMDRPASGSSMLVATVASAVLSLAYAAATAPANPALAHAAHGNGGPPLIGIVGLLACIATGAVLTVARRTRRPSPQTVA